MPKVGVMLTITSDQIARGLTTADIARALAGVVTQINRSGEIEGDYTHNDTGIAIQIRTEGLSITEPRRARGW